MDFHDLLYMLVFSGQDTSERSTWASTTHRTGANSNYLNALRQNSPKFDAAELHGTNLGEIEGAKGGEDSHGGFDRRTRVLPVRQEKQFQRETIVLNVSPCGEISPEFWVEFLWISYLFVIQHSSLGLHKSFFCFIGGARSHLRVAQGLWVGAVATN